MRIFSALFVSAFIAIGSLSAQQDTNIKATPIKLSPERQKYYEQLMKDKQKNNPTLQSNEMRQISIQNINDTDVQNLKIDWKAIPPQKPNHSLLNPIEIQTNEDININNIKGIEVEKKSSQLQEAMTQLPEKMRYVAEFEESQAVIVSFPCTPAFSISDSNGQASLYPMFTGVDFPDYFNFCKPGEGIFSPYFLGLSNNQNDTYVVPISIWLANIQLAGQEDTTEAYVWSNLINAIQQECQVWIRMTGLQDTLMLKNYMIQKGIPLIEGRYKFFSEPAGEDAFWARDWGPHGFYYDDNGTQKLAFNDAMYYTGRAFDDVFPRKILTEMGYDYYDLQLHLEGGNIMTDGNGQATYGDVIYEGNGQSAQGQYYYDTVAEKWKLSPFTKKTSATIDAEMKVAFALEDPNLVKSLKYDGGTGHIDLWIKQFDEETMLIANMPEKYNGLTDYKLIQQNREYLSNRKTCFGTNYRFLNAPMPRRTDGPYPTSDGEMPANDSLYNLDPRGYLNGLVVNKSYIYPTFSQKGEAGYAHDSANNEILKKILPGYKLVPIDARYLTPGGGAIHCITMQIPAEKVITIKHKPIRGGVERTSSYSFEAEFVSNNVDEPADKMMLYWKTAGETTWNKAEMLDLTDDTNFIYTYQLQNEFTESDTVQYYIAAQKGDVIKKTNPIVAQEGGEYAFWFATSSIDELYGFEPSGSLIASVYPNPATEYVNIIFENMNPSNVTIEICNTMGQVLLTPVNNKHFESGVFTADVTNLNLPAGSYFIKMRTETGNSVSGFVITK